MRAVGVVLDPPIGDEDLRFKQGVELFDGEQLVAQTAAVGLDPGVLPGRAGLDVAGARAAVAAPVPQGVGGELGTVVAADELGMPAAGADDLVQAGDRCVSVDGVVDEHTREALAVEVERRIDADRTVSVLERVVTRRGRRPELLRMANGPELTANALRDWCRFSGSGTSYIEPGSPWENPFVESFASRVRDEVLAVEAFDSLPEAKIVIEDWRHTYNTVRPHSSLGWKTPAAYAADWRTQGNLTLIASGPMNGVRSVLLSSWTRRAVSISIVLTDKPRAEVVAERGSGICFIRDAS